MLLPQAPSYALQRLPGGAVSIRGGAVSLGSVTSAADALELWNDAGAAYRRALALTANAPERAYLERRLAELGADTA